MEAPGEIVEVNAPEKTRRQVKQQGYERNRPKRSRASQRQCDELQEELKKKPLGVQFRLTNPYRWLLFPIWLPEPSAKPRKDELSAAMQRLEHMPLAGRVQ